MAANIFANGNKPVAHNGRNGFDLSSAHTLTMRCGVVRPVIVQDTVPNSSFKINCGDIVRTSGLQTAAFLRGRHELDFFFVPYRQLYSNFDNVVFGRGDVHSPALDVSGDVPLVELVPLYQAAIDTFVLSKILLNYRKLLKGSFPSNPRSVIDYTLGAYFEGLGFYYHGETTPMYYTDNKRNFLLDAICFDKPDVTSSNWVNSCHPKGAALIQLLSSLGYGDIYLRIKDLLDANYNGWAEEGEPFHALRDQAFIYGIIVGKFIDKVDAQNMHVNILRLAAYQKVWFDTYRDSINDDDVLYRQAISSDLTTSVSRNFINTLYEQFAENYDASITFSLLDVPAHLYLCPRLRQFKKDLNTGLYPTAQFGDAATLSIDSSEIYADGYNSSTSVGLQVGKSAGNLYNQVNGSINNTKFTINDAFSAYDVKYTFALQKYREMLLRAGNRTRDLLMAEFGVKSRYIDDSYVHNLGSFGGSLDINKVSATAETGSYSVGDLAANIFTSLQGDTIEFTCNDYGVIIGVMSFLPEMFHNATGINPFVYKYQQFDFFHEAFENLGLQPVGNKVFDGLVEDNTHGFGARFNEYKQNMDLSHDNFMSSPNWVDFTPDFHDEALANRYAINNSGTNSNYVTNRNSMQDISNLSDRNYIMPDSMDSLFTSVDDGTPETAHFDVALQCNMTAVLPMSVLGTI